MSTHEYILVSLTQTVGASEESDVNCSPKMGIASPMKSLPSFDLPNPTQFLLHKIRPLRVWTIIRLPNYVFFPLNCFQLFILEMINPLDRSNIFLLSRPPKRHLSRHLNGSKKVTCRTNRPPMIEPEALPTRGWAWVVWWACRNLSCWWPAAPISEALPPPASW